MRAIDISKSAENRSETRQYRGKLTAFSMEESEFEPIPEKPRFLLPHGCRDLVDVLNQQEEAMERVRFGFPFLSGSGKIETSKFPPAYPRTVALPESITVPDLAAAIHVPLLHMLMVLPMCKISTALSQPLDFPTAKALCALYGVEAVRAD
jgi:hypothetical protein